jgi:hypothetical protein
MTIWFIPLGIALIACGILWLRFRARVSLFLADVREVTMGSRDGWWIFKPINTPVAGAIGFIVGGAIFLGVGVAALVIALG